MRAAANSSAHLSPSSSSSSRKFPQLYSVLQQQLRSGTTIRDDFYLSYSRLRCRAVLVVLLRVICTHTVQCAFSTMGSSLGECVCVFFSSSFYYSLTFWTCSQQGPKSRFNLKLLFIFSIIPLEWLKQNDKLSDRNAAILGYKSPPLPFFFFFLFIPVYLSHKQSVKYCAFTWNYYLLFIAPHPSTDTMLNWFSFDYIAVGLPCSSGCCHTHTHILHVSWWIFLHPSTKYI